MSVEKGIYLQGNLLRGDRVNSKLLTLLFKCVDHPYLKVDLDHHSLTIITTFSPEKVSETEFWKKALY